MNRRSLGHRAPLLWIVFPFLAGLAVARATGWNQPGVTMICAALTAVGALVAAWRDARAWVPLLMLTGALAGAAAYAQHRQRLPDWDALPPREAQLALRVDRMFPATFPQRASGMGTIVAAAPHLADLAGQRIYFALSLGREEPPPIRSTVLQVSGVLTVLPEHAAPNSFDGYLASAGINFKLTRARVLRVESAPWRYYRMCADAANRFRAILGAGIAEKRPTLAGLLRAMMLGETNELSEEQHALFMQSGTMHLFAISGLNIAVIAGAIQALLLLLRLPPWARFAIGTSLLWLFVDITGAAPSAVRAFVMAAFLKAAFVLRRPANPLAALAASALAVLVISPLQAFGASFLMSYGIVVALLIFGLPLSEAWQERWALWRDLPPATWTRWQKFCAGAWRDGLTALAIGLATTLVSTLTSVQYFGLFTPASLVANLALIPAAMAATVAGFASLMCGLVGFGTGASLCNHAAALVLLAIEELVRFGVQIPGAHVPARFAAPWLGSAAIAALLVALFFGYAGNWQRERGGWWPPFALVALVLAFGVKFG